MDATKSESTYTPRAVLSRVACTNYVLLSTIVLQQFCNAVLLLCCCSAASAVFLICTERRPVTAAAAVSGRSRDFEIHQSITATIATAALFAAVCCPPPPALRHGALLGEPCHNGRTTLLAAGRLRQLYFHSTILTYISPPKTQPSRRYEYV